MRTYPTHPQVGIGLVLLRGEKVLLIRRGKPPGAGNWSIPGGRQELGETAEACARRELLEETGLSCGPLVLAGHADSIHRDGEQNIEYHYTILDFTARYTGGEAAPGDDVTDATWVTPQNFDAYNVSPEARKIILKAFSLLPP